MDIVLDVAFVIALTAFLKEQFGLTGRAVLIAAFVICLGFGLAPLIADLIPATLPYVQVLFKTLLLFFSAAGSYDAIVAFKLKKFK